MTSWNNVLGYLTGSVDKMRLLRLDYVPEENRILRRQLSGRLNLTDTDRRTLAEKGRRLGRMLADTVTIVQPETLLRYHAERHHQGTGHVMPFPDGRAGCVGGEIVKNEHLGGLLILHHRAA